MLLAVCEPEAVGDAEDAPFVCGTGLGDMMRVGCYCEYRREAGVFGEMTAPGYTDMQVVVDNRFESRTQLKTRVQVISPLSELLVYVSGGG